VCGAVGLWSWVVCVCVCCKSGSGSVLVERRPAWYRDGPGYGRMTSSGVCVERHGEGERDRQTDREVRKGVLSIGVRRERESRGILFSSMSVRRSNGRRMRRAARESPSAS
jgi:hypothetical protein